MMPNRSNMRNRRVSSQLFAVNCAPDNGVLSRAESAGDEPRPPIHNDRLYVVGEAEQRTGPVSRPPQERAGEEAGRAAEISNTVVDSDIRAAKWAWAVLVIGHCWLIYFMVQNLG